MYKIATVIDQEGVIFQHAILDEEDIPFYEMKQPPSGIWSSPETSMTRTS